MGNFFDNIQSKLQIDDPTDVINLSYTSFLLVQPKNLKEMIVEIKKEMEVIMDLQLDMKDSNEKIKNKILINGEDIFYKKGLELEKYLEDEIIMQFDGYDFNGLATSVYERAFEERKMTLYKYINLTTEKILKLTEATAAPTTLGNVANNIDNANRITNLNKDLALLKLLLQHDSNIQQDSLNIKNIYSDIFS